MSEEIPKPFLVFISSSQDEFRTLRHRLRHAINFEKFVDYPIMKGILIEDERRTCNQTGHKGKNRPIPIYIGIFGRVRSKWTIAELNELRKRAASLDISLQTNNKAWETEHSSTGT